MSLTSLPVVEIAGGPRERGRQYGEQARERIHRALAYYAEAFAHSSGLAWPQVTQRAARWVEPSKAFAPDLVEEMEGIADGAGVEFLDIVALNARGEIIYDTTFNSMEPDGCTSFALMEQASGDGHVYAGVLSSFSFASLSDIFGWSSEAVGGLPISLMQASLATSYASCRSPKSIFPASFGSTKPLSLRHDRNLTSHSVYFWSAVPAEADELFGGPLDPLALPQPASRPARQAKAANATRVRGR